MIRHRSSAKNWQFLLKLQVLQDLLVRYMKMIGVRMKDRAELCNRTEPNLRDLELTFEDLSISLEELGEYMEQFDSKAVVTEPVPLFPQPSETRLNHLKPGSREVLHRPVHVHEHLPPMYPEMETEQGTTSLDDKTMMDIKTEAPSSMNSNSDPSDQHPLREIASVMMTSSGFISPAREGRMADSRTPAVSRLATNNTNLLDDDSRPGSVESKKRSKAADDTSDEGLISDDDDDKDFTATAKPIKDAKAGSKLSVFQKKKTTKTPKEKKDPTVKKAGPGRPRGRKKKVDIAPVSKEILSTDEDSSPERESKKRPKAASPPMKKARPVEPPVEINVSLNMPPPDPTVLPNNPLIPKYFGFEGLNSSFDKLEPEPPEPASASFEEITIKEEPLFQQPSISHSSPGSSSLVSLKKEDGEISKESKKEKKLKDKALKKAKKEKKEKNRDKERSKEHKSEKRDKDKKKKKERERPPSPQLFAGTDQTTTTSVPKLKIKDIKSEEVASPLPPKIVIKNLEKKKEAPKEPDVFSDPIHIDRPKSAASDGSTGGKIKIKKEKKKESHDDERKRSSSGGSKREKRPSAIAAEAAIQASTPPEDVPSIVTATPEAAATPSSFIGGSVVTQTVGFYVDAEGNQIWICPACGKQDDGSPMIGCDECDDWYHWMCVGIQSEPADNQDWFCPRCVARKSTMYLERKTPGKRGRPPKIR